MGLRNELIVRRLYRSVYIYFCDIKDKILVII